MLYTETVTADETVDDEAPFQSICENKLWITNGGSLGRADDPHGGERKHIYCSVGLYISALICYVKVDSMCHS